MGRIIALIVGVYLAIGAVAAAGAAYGFATGKGPDYECSENDLAITAGAAPKGTTGSNSAVNTLAFRLFAWPLAISPVTSGDTGLFDWFTLNYPYAPDACRWGDAAHA